MSVPRRQIGWSQKANLYHQISLQLDRLIKLRTGIAPTTTSTTTAPLFSGTVYWGEDSATACGEFLPITATGDGTTFCNTSTFTGSGFSVIGTGVVVISAGGQLKTVSHVSGDPFVTFGGGCDPCPPPVYTYSAQFDGNSPSNACYNPTTTPNVYSADSVLIVGSVLFYNGDLTSPVTEGYYAIDGFIYHPVIDGVIETIEACSSYNLTLRIENSANFNIPAYIGDASSDFTIEWWGRMSADDNHPRPWSIGSSPDAAHAVSIENGQFYYWINGSILKTIDVSVYNVIGNWRHFCIMRGSDTIYFFIDGAQIGTLVNTDAIPTNGYPLYLGSEGNDSIQNGLMSNFRWNTTAVYDKTGFTPPIAPLASIFGTMLLMFQGTTLSDEITDQSGMGYVITNGTGLYNTINPFVGYEGCILFFNYPLATSFKADNTLGNASLNGGSVVGALYTGYINYDAYVDWGDGVSEYYQSNVDQFFAHYFLSNNIFDVKIYMQDPTNISSYQNSFNKGVFYMLELDQSALTNVNYMEIDINKLSSTQINKVLNDLVNNGLTGGTVVTINQTPLAPPTGQGIIDKNILISRGWTVQTD